MMSNLGTDYAKLAICGGSLELLPMMMMLMIMMMIISAKDLAKQLLLLLCCCGFNCMEHT